MGFLGGFVYFFFSPPHEPWSAARAGAVVAVVFGALAVAFGDRLFAALRYGGWL